MRIGSEKHKRLFCESFIAAHRDYDPEKISWPTLSDTDLLRLRAIPFWRTALAVETNAGYLVSAFAKTIEDPLLARAVALQGEEEARHASLLRTMFRRYGIEGFPNASDASRERATPSRQNFSDFGYEECLDSYFGYGLFGVARQARYFDEDFIHIFEPLLCEETQHIVFFVNWVAYERVRAGHAWLTPLLTIYGYLRAFGRLMRTARDVAHDGTGFAALGSEQMIRGLSLQQFLSSCRMMNEDFMSVIDPRLLRPRIIPTIANMILRFMPVAHQARIVPAQ
jgi:hypothetical protein